jgi:hypothetical protein
LAGWKVTPAADTRDPSEDAADPILANGERPGADYDRRTR